jgi:hypothetical protein
VEEKKNWLRTRADAAPGFGSLILAVFAALLALICLVLISIGHATQALWRRCRRSPSSRAEAALNRRSRLLITAGTAAWIGVLALAYLIGSWRIMGSFALFT